MLEVVVAKPSDEQKEDAKFVSRPWPILRRDCRGADPIDDNHLVYV